MAGALLAYTLTLSFQRRKSYRRIPSWNNSRARSSFIKLLQNLNLFTQVVKLLTFRQVTLLVELIIL